MSKRIGLGVLIAAGFLAVPSGSAFAQQDAAVQQDENKLVVPALSDEDVSAQIEAMRKALASDDANAIRGALSGGALIARGLSNNRAVSDEQVETLVAAANELKESHAKYAAQLDQFIFKVENLTIGRKAPNIEGVDTDKVEFELNDYLGKVVVIDFWGDW